MNRYVLGFAFTPDNRVALIQKRKPAWQAGRWNGIGGKIEGAETPVLAMSREFQEETGVYIAPELWREAGVMVNWGDSNHPDREGWSVIVFTYTGPEVRNVQTMEAEDVSLWHIEGVLNPFNRGRLMNNIPALVELCRLKPEGGDAAPQFELRY